MGGQKQYNKSGGFSQYLYHQIGETIVAGGVSAKVVERIDNPHTGLPKYSNTSSLYFKQDENGVIEPMNLEITLRQKM